MASEREQARRIARELAGVVGVAVRGIGEGVLNEAVRTTPVDTGLSAASWQASQRGPVTEVVGDRSPSGVGRAAAAQEASRTAIDTWQRGTLSIGSGEGNVARLQDGNVSGRQSSAGFVQRAIRKGIGAGAAKAIAAARAASRRR